MTILTNLPLKQLQYHWKKLTGQQKLTLLFVVLLAIIIPLASINSLQTKDLRSKALTISPIPFLQISLEEALGPKGKFLPQEKIAAKIGDEYIYNRDLNYQFYTYHRDKFNNFDLISTPEEKRNIKKLLLEELKEESILFQYALKKNITASSDISNNIFNALNKNYEARKQKATLLRQQLDANREKTEGEFLSIWYFNVNPPSIDILESQKLAFDTISQIYNLVKSGTDFQKAAEIIKNNSQLEKIDKGYQNNAYLKFENVSPGQNPTPFFSVNEAYWKLKPGEISPIIHVSQISPDLKRGEAFYAIIKKSSVINQGMGKLSDQLTAENKTIQITEYED